MRGSIPLRLPTKESKMGKIEMEVVSKFIVRNKNGLRFVIDPNDKREVANLLLKKFPQSEGWKILVSCEQVSQNVWSYENEDQPWWGMRDDPTYKEG